MPAATQAQQEAFIKKVAPIFKKWAKHYGYKTCAGAIAQACHECGYGVGDGSEVKVAHNNILGIKYNPKAPKRLDCHNGYFDDKSKEEYTKGQFTPITALWYSFANLDMCIKGYYEFLEYVPSRYANLKLAENPADYLVAIQNDGYATGKEYAKHTYEIVIKHNLAEYDKDLVRRDESTVTKKVGITETYTNSPLVTYTKISPNKTSPRNHKIDTITIHVMAGNLSVQSCGNVFQNKAASSNYGIDSNGNVGLYVEECDRSWCSSNSANDNRAITIEVANDGGPETGYHVTDKALLKLVELIVDVCRRNDIKELKWRGDKSLIGQVDKQNMTVHRWFKAKACPGDYLYNLHPWIANAVNQALKK